MKKRVLIGMSGGVDSSAAVILLQEQDYEVVGVTFQFIDDFDKKDAVEVSKKLSIEHHIENYTKEFKKDVIDKFINDYSIGLTPNPCVNCNKVCKFKYLFECMEKYNCDYIATGHYARIENKKLYRGRDLEKDQSYFLYDLQKDKLDKILFPLEGYTKEEIREIARKNNLINSEKKDSFDVCFIKNKFTDFIKENSNQVSGDVINIDTNEVMGKHIGLMYYTIGQRKGLNIGGNEDKLYVVGKDIDKNILYVSLGSDNNYLISDSCLVEKFNLITDNKLNKCTAKFRYRQKDIDVEVDYLDANKILVKYPQGVKSVTPGQSCVLYNKEECLGGGIIKEVYKDNNKLWYL